MKLADPIPSSDETLVQANADVHAIKYCIITPTRDEEKYLNGTIEAVIAQTIRPIEWIIVNDGSKDRTGQIIDDYASRYGWIRAFHREDRGFRSTGGGIDGFLDAYERLQSKNWQFLVNLDGDLTFAPDYFERCFEQFRSQSSLGIAGGTIFNKVGDELQLEPCRSFHVRGATKIYRRECWDDMGGMLRGLGWDTFDEVTANMRGWKTGSFPDIHLVHHRFTGTADGRWRGLVKDGRADYIIGYHPMFFAAKCVGRLFKSPLVVGSVGLLWGFASGYLKGVQRVKDHQFVNYVRQQQLNSLLGKDSIWK
jgi:biofilm PGA synthesis N-glycosyltransferase PgaC